MKKVGRTIEWESIGGAFPTQAEGAIDGHPFYYRSRGGSWSLEIAEEPDGDPMDVAYNGTPGWHWTGTDRFAGNVPVKVVEELIRYLTRRSTELWPSGGYGPVSICVPWSLANIEEITDEHDKEFSDSIKEGLKEWKKRLSIE